MIQGFTDLLDLARDCSTMRLAVAVADDEEVIKAVKMASDKDLIKPVLVGEEANIKNTAREMGLKLEGLEIIKAEGNQNACQKAVKLVSSGDCELLMKGMVSTSKLMKEVLNEDYGLKTDRLISHIAMVDSSQLNRLVFVTDGGMNIKPTLDQKKQIIKNAVEVARLLGYKKPKVAVLAAVEKVNDQMPETMEAAALAKMNERGQISKAIVDGPLALDNALSSQASKIKGIQSPVAGQADILLVPEIISGNILGKSPVYLGGDDIATIIGGTTNPIVLTSRANKAKIKLISIAAAVIMAEKKGFKRGGEYEK